MFGQQYKGYALLVMFFLLSVAVVKYTPEQATDEEPKKLEHIADHFAVNYSKVQMDELGVPKDKLTADYAVHYSDNDETELTKPIMTVYKDNLPPWVIRSQAGLILAGGEKIFLNGQVYIDRAAAENVREINIKTTNLRVEPKRNYAETDEWAELKSGLDIMSGVGMKFFYQNPLYLELLANVKGIHVYE